jgi:hypothetical protein
MQAGKEELDNAFQKGPDGHVQSFADLLKGADAAVSVYCT